MAYGETGENTRQDAGRVADAGKTAAKAGTAAAKKIKAAKAGAKAGKKAAGKAVSHAGGLFLLKWKLIILGVFFLFMLLVGIIASIPSLIGNVLIHQNDPEALSDQQDITYYGTYEEDMEKFTATADRAREVVVGILNEAYSSAYSSLSSAASANGWVFDGEPAAVTEQTTDESMVILYSTYSASMKNALSDEAFDYYQETSAIDDMAEKLRALKGQKSTDAPYGNRIHGADFMRDENGAVIVTEVEVAPAYTDEETGISYDAEYEYQVTPIIFNVDIDDVSQAAFSVDMTAIYDEEANPYNTYADVVTDMSYSIGTIIFGEDFWDGADVFFPGLLGVPDDFIVNTAYSQVGQVGGRPYWSWYGFGSRVEWCACFVSWCADQCGYLEAGIIPRYSSCADAVSWFKSEHRWQARRTGYKPKPGDIIFFDWADDYGRRDGKPNHTGIVMSFENGTVYTVEGNSGDRVKTKSYSVNSLNILGYGTPDYPEPVEEEAEEGVA